MRVIKMQFAGTYLLERLIEDRKFDDRGSLDRCVGRDGDSLVRLEILGKQRDLAVMRRCDSLYPRLQRRERDLRGEGRSRERAEENTEGEAHGENSRRCRTRMPVAGEELPCRRP